MAVLDLNAKFSGATEDDNDSRKYMIYESDNGTLYSVFISENIGETFGFAIIGANDNVPALPPGFEMRKVYAASASGKVRQSFPVGTASTPVYQEGGVVTVARKGKAAGLALGFTGSVGEKKRFISGLDTGQTSGDIT